MTDFMRMVELFGGFVGGLGFFLVGMHFLTENLSAVASRRLRKAASRWTGNRYSALGWGAIGGFFTQSMSAVTFIVASFLRSGLLGTPAALAVILGACVGVSAPVFVATFDVKAISFLVLGIAGAVVVSEKLSKYRPVAVSVLGSAMIIIGLILLKESAAPLSEQPWFREILAGAGDSLVLAFLAAVVLTATVQSSSAVCVLGIGMATVGAISVDQAIMVVYGSLIGSSLIIYLLSAGLRGRPRQLAMYMVSYNLLICMVLVPLLYCELYFDIPLMKALVLSFDLELAQQLALVFVLLGVLPLPVMLAGLNLSVSILEKLWPASTLDELSQPKFIHQNASEDLGNGLRLAEMEQRRVFGSFSRYFDMVRQKKSVMPLRAATRNVLSDISEFLSGMEVHHPRQEFEVRSVMMKRQRLLARLEESLSGLCEALATLPGKPAHERLRASVCEGIDGVLLVLVEAMERNDRESWKHANEVTGERREVMENLRRRYIDMKPSLKHSEVINMIAITNTVEEVFLFLSRLEFNAGSFLSDAWVVEPPAELERPAPA